MFYARVPEYVQSHEKPYTDDIVQEVVLKQELHETSDAHSNTYDVLQVQRMIGFEEDRRCVQLFRATISEYEHHRCDSRVQKSNRVWPIHLGRSDKHLRKTRPEQGFVCRVFLQHRGQC